MWTPGKQVPLASWGMKEYAICPAAPVTQTVRDLLLITNLYLYIDYQRRTVSKLRMIFFKDNIFILYLFVEILGLIEI
jgi:hypothetical protein